VGLFAVLRHGGTPNLGSEVRAIPSVGFTAPWYSAPPSAAQVTGNGPFIPAEVWQSLSELGQRCTKDVAMRPGETWERPWRPTWDTATRKPGSSMHARHDGSVLPKL
jgi:hypothetical protein